MMLPILTDRLEIRPYRPDDVERAHEVLYGNAQARRLTGGVSDLEETRTAIERFIERGRLDGYSYWAVLERDSGELIGEAGLKPLDDHGPEVEIGYAFGPASWGRGYATEAGRAILDAAFGPLGLEQVVAVTREANTGSQRVIAKLGFIPAGRRHVYGDDLLFFVLDRRRSP
jgi:ribosomal-protein-alanine N-acetyltransferase